MRVGNKRGGVKSARSEHWRYRTETCGFTVFPLRNKKASARWPPRAAAQRACILRGAHAHLAADLTERPALAILHHG